MIVNIQYLRFIAAFSVIIAHAGLQAYGIDAKITNPFGVGVDIFFVISGFIMPFIIYGGFYKAGSEPTCTPISFMAKRFIRIWPLFFIVTSTFVFISFLVTNEIIKNPTVDFAYHFNYTILDFDWYIKSLFFASFDRHLIMGLTWTLQFEFIFYSTMAILIAFQIKKIEFIEISIVALLIGGSILSYSGIVQNSISKVIFHPMMIEFVFGVYLYRMLSRNILLPVYFATLVIVFFIPLFIFLNSSFISYTSDFSRVIFWGTPAFFLVWAALSLEGRIPKNKFFLLLGDASYSLYLTHGLTAPFFIFAWESYGLHHNINMYAFIILYCMFCQCCGVLCYKYIESPISKKIRAWQYSKKLTPPSLT